MCVYHTTITFFSCEQMLYQDETHYTIHPAIEDNRKIRFTMKPAHVRRI